MLELNLFHEQQELQRERDYDPVRLTLLGGALLITLIVLWGSILYLRMGELRSNLAKRHTELIALNKELAGLGQLTDFPKIQAQAKSLDTRIQTRTLFATQLDILREVIPTNFQVRSFKTGRSMKETETTVAGKKGNITIKKSQPSLDILVELEARGKDKVEVLQMRDNLMDALRRNPRLAQWAHQIPDESEKGTWNEIVLLKNITKDPKSGDPAVGQFDIDIPIALKDEPKEISK